MEGAVARKDSCIDLGDSLRTKAVGCRMEKRESLEHRIKGCNVPYHGGGGGS